MATNEHGREIYSDLAIHPGEILEEELEARGMTQKALAAAMRRPPQVVNEIVRGKKGITAETALELERVLGSSARLWMNLQTTYALTLAHNAGKQRAG
jgi:HTH-type transcriptional regulator/antitoxin HigA